MSGPAADRLVEAALALPPLDRALLNLWVHHGYDDAALARMTGSTPERVATQRRSALSTLSDAVGASPEEVLEGLRALEPGITAPSTAANGAPAPPAVSPPAEAAAAAEAPHAAEAATPAEAPQPAEAAAPAEAQPAEPAPPAEAPPTAEPPVPAPVPAPGRPGLARRRRRPLGWILGLLGVASAAAIVLAALGGSASSPRRPSLPPGKRTRAVSPAPQALAALPGGPPGAAGSLTLRGTGRAAVVTLTVHRLTAPAGGRIELWLYNTIIDSLPLGAVPADGTVTVRLPPDYRRYRWLDVSLQPPGAHVHSGISVLRTAVP